MTMQKNLTHQVSILPTFYEQLSVGKYFEQRFSVLTDSVCIFLLNLQTDKKAACKMLVKLLQK